MSHQGLNYLAQFGWSFNPHSDPFPRPRRKLKEVHKRLNELRELVQYYEQTSDMMVDAVNENVKEDEEDEDEAEEGTEDGSMFEAMFDSEQENRQSVTNIRCLSFRCTQEIAGCPGHSIKSLNSLFAFCLSRNLQLGGNWADLNRGANRRGARAVAATSTNNRNGRLNTEREINNRSAANLRSLNIPSAIGQPPHRSWHAGQPWNALTLVQYSEDVTLVFVFF